MSNLEETLLFHIKALNLPIPEREFRFHKTRRWRFDFAFIDKMIAVECEGGIYARKKDCCKLCGQPPRSGHTSMTGYEKDCEKYNAAALLGWKVLRFTSKSITSGDAARLIELIFR